VRRSKPPPRESYAAPALDDLPRAQSMPSITNEGQAVEESPAPLQSEPRGTPRSAWVALVAGAVAVLALAATLAVRSGARSRTLADKPVESSEVTPLDPPSTRRVGPPPADTSIEIVEVPAPASSTAARPTMRPRPNPRPKPVATTPGF
jgi:hypothetical protein